METDPRRTQTACVITTMRGVIIQNDRTDYTIKLNTDGEIDVPPLLCKFTEVLGKDANIHVEFVDEIPVQASNKRRAVICNYEKG